MGCCQNSIEQKLTQTELSQEEKIIFECERQIPFSKHDADKVYSAIRQNAKKDKLNRNEFKKLENFIGDGFSLEDALTNIDSPVFHFMNQFKDDSKKTYHGK